MRIFIKNPEFFTIVDAETGASYFGGDQEWYTVRWAQRAGCGPVCAANVLSYLAFSQPGLRGLYAGEDRSRRVFLRHMEEMYAFVTPGGMGLNRVDMYTRGVDAFARSRGLALAPHVFDVPGCMAGKRPPAEALADFVKKGLEADCPLGFLNLTRGKVRNIQAWHWITITGLETGEGGVFAHASDEGEHLRFDLGLWYQTTRMQGGLVYFTPGAG